MEKPFTLLERVKTLILHEKLPCLTPYTQARQDSDALWNLFCANHPPALRSQVLDLLDSRDAVTNLEQDAAFCLGLQLGLELGRLPEFWDGEA